jgi:hypothetical protein
MLPAFAALVIAISSSADLSPTLVDHVVAETNAIWKPAGVTLVWRRDDVPATAVLHVTIGQQRGNASAYVAPLGWIEFDDGQPQPRLYLSYPNATALFESSRGVVGEAAKMPILERETYLGRALGRALAHEIGHYLLATRTHTTAGLMKANFTATEFFLPDTRHFTLTDAQRTLALARIDQVPLVASAATSGSSSPTSRPPASPPQGAARWPGPTPHQ